MDGGSGLSGGGGGYFGGGGGNLEGDGGGGASYPAPATQWDTTQTPSVTITTNDCYIPTPTLAIAAPGAPIAPVTLQVAGVGVSTGGYVTTLKWKKVSLPKGLKISKATGVLSGTPSTKLSAGPTSVEVSVTETVTTLNGKKKVKTKTTVEVTIPLTIA